MNEIKRTRATRQTNSANSDCAAATNHMAQSHDENNNTYTNKATTTQEAPQHQSHNNPTTAIHCDGCAVATVAESDSACGVANVVDAAIPLKICRPCCSLVP